MYLLRGEEDKLHHNTLVVDLHQYDDVPLGGILRKLGDAFIASSQVRKLAAFCGQSKIKVREKELRMLLRLVHNGALILCTEKCLENGTIPEEEANRLLDGFRNINQQPQAPFDLPDNKLRTINKEPDYGISEYFRRWNLSCLY